MVWSVKKKLVLLYGVSPTPVCLKDEKPKNRLDNSKKTPVLDIRLKIVIVVSVKIKSGNFEEHCSGWSC